MKKVVVLGGSGFVGRSLSPVLAGAGHEVWSVSRSPVIRRDSRVHYIDCNFDNIYQLGELYETADVIFHLACDTTPATSSRQSSLEVTTNLLPTLRMLEYLEHHCSATLVYVSSGGTIYGDAGGESASHGEADPACEETAPMSPISYYGASKASIELFLSAYHRQTGNGVVVLRPSNIYGPGQLAKQQFGIVPTLLNAIREGAEFRLLGDGENSRDFLYIDDFTRLCATVIASGAGASHQTINAGCGEGVSLNHLVSLAEAVTDSKVNLTRLPGRPVDVRSIVLDATLARETYGWQATTSLEAGLRDTWGWMAAD
jgi:UDP-glucose 4-epimerase